MTILQKKQAQSGILQAVCVVAGLFIAFPILYCISLSFMQPNEIISNPRQLLPSGFYLGNFSDALRMSKIPRFIVNSLFISLVCSTVRMIVASLAGYAFAFYEFHGKKFLFFMVLGSMLIPADATLVTNYMTVSHMGLVDHYLGIMILYFVSATNIFLMRQYFMTVSKELKDAAEIDGCGSFRFYSRILLPVSKPILATVFIASFVSTWNMYMWPLVVTNRNEMRTVQVGISMLNFSEESVYGATMAGAVLVLIPSLLIFIVSQKRIVSGMTTGSVKG